MMKSGRIPNAEFRMPKEVRKPKLTGQAQIRFSEFFPLCGILDFELRFSDLILRFLFSIPAP